MKKIWPVVLFVAIAVVVGLYFFKNKNSASSPASATNKIVSADSSTAAVELKNSGAALPSSPTGSANGNSPADLSARAFPASSITTPGTNETPKLAPYTILDNARVVINSYRDRFGGNPVGTNPEITAALLGENPKQVNFITPESGLRVNGNGELVDAWGTPFFFHQLSGREMEIHSAGPDRVMWTLDDLVIK